MVHASMRMQMSMHARWKYSPCALARWLSSVHKLNRHVQLELGQIGSYFDSKPLTQADGVSFLSLFHAVAPLATVLRLQLVSRQDFSSDTLNTKCNDVQNSFAQLKVSALT